MEESKDEEAEKLLGMRNNGKPIIPIFFPEELGYVCPICGLGDEFTDGELQWSEYACMIYCPKCNIDIPSMLCLKYPEPRLGNKKLSKKQKIIRAKKVFYASCRTAIKNSLKDEVE